MRTAPFFCALDTESRRGKSASGIGRGSPKQGRGFSETAPDRASGLRLLWKRLLRIRLFRARLFRMRRIWTRLFRMRFVPDETGLDKTAFRKAGSGRNAAGRNGANRLFPASGSGWILLRTAQDRPSQAYGFGEETFLSEGAAFPKNEGAGREGISGRIRRAGIFGRAGISGRGGIFGKAEGPERPESPEGPEGCRPGLAFSPLGQSLSAVSSGPDTLPEAGFPPE